jgi:hypothetical protein
LTGPVPPGTAVDADVTTPPKTRTRMFPCRAAAINAASRETHCPELKISRYSNEVPQQNDLFESAIDGVVAGDVPALRALLISDPGMVMACSSRPHRATLLHYVAANGG